jgi:hypothetical protein
LDNIGRDLPQRSVVHDDLGELDIFYCMRQMRLGYIVTIMLLLGEQGIGNGLLLITSGVDHQVSPLQLGAIGELLSVS